MMVSQQLLICIALAGLVCGCVFAESKPADAKPDARLTQKVTYQAQFRSVQQILSDLSDMTGVELNAGSRNSDWPVRSRKMNIFVKDVKLSELMISISHTMKFRWSRNGRVSPPTYRLVVDKKAAAEADAMMKRVDKMKEETWQTRRDEWIDAIDKYGSQSSSELESLRKTNPVVYRNARYGALQSLHALFNEVPETKERFAAGRSFRISAYELSPRTKSLVYSAGDGYWEYLQISNQVDKQPDGSLGYGNVLRLDDGFDVAYCRMDEIDGFTPGLRWGGPSVSAGYFHLISHKNGKDLELADLRAINENWSRVACEVNNYILDGEPMPSDMGIRYDRAQVELINQEESLYPSEPLNEHSDFPELAEMVKLKLEEPKADQNPALAVNSYVASFQKAVFESAGLNVVSDSWANIEGEKLPEQEMKLGDILEKFSKNYNYNWDKPASILEFRHRKWAKMRLNQIPDEWITTWSENTRKNGYLSLDDLADISDLNYYQAEESLKSDKVLGCTGLYDQIIYTLDRDLLWLRLYSSLTPQLKALLTGQFGVNGQMLTSQQWKLAQPMFDRIGSSRGDAMFRMLVETKDKDITCRFKEIDTDSDEEDRVWELSLIRYEAPVSKENAKK